MEPGAGRVQVGGRLGPWSQAQVGGRLGPWSQAQVGDRRSTVDEMSFLCSVLCITTGLNDTTVLP